ncbi:hypothetical protein ACIRF8_12885 [Streptomyces sp. NPDC102406]|uniref:hypothetical protein n=1 Tax=Streptomyces sp. NPDC102406 TaxID=3366171 RepID=UPI0037F86A18
MTERQPRSLRISTPAGRGGHLVELDGVDVSRALYGLTLTVAAGGPPTAVLNVVAKEIPTELDGVRAHLPDATRELLVQLGWTPPAEEASS